MKQIRNTFVRLVLFCVCGFFFLSNYAQSYQDDSDELREKNWEHWGKYAIWKTEDGLLKGMDKLATFPPRESKAYNRTAPIQRCQWRIDSETIK